MDALDVEGERAAVLIDFGGVLTTSVLAVFEDFGTSIGQPDLLLSVFSSDEISRRLLADHESGRIDASTFERGLAEQLRAHGANVDADGLITRMQQGLRRDDDTVDLVTDLRSAGVPVALVSNAFGRDTYRGFDLDELADVVVISSEVGIRKPSRRIYAIACERLGIAPERAVMVDDLQQNLDGAARIGIAGVLHTSASDTREQLAHRFAIRGTHPIEQALR